MYVKFNNTLVEFKLYRDKLLAQEITTQCYRVAGDPIYKNITCYLAFTGAPCIYADNAEYVTISTYLLDPTFNSSLCQVFNLPQVIRHNTPYILEHLILPYIGEELKLILGGCYIRDLL